MSKLTNCNSSGKTRTKDVKQAQKFYFIKLGYMTFIFIFVKLSHLIQLLSNKSSAYILCVLLSLDNEDALFGHLIFVPHILIVLLYSNNLVPCLREYPTQNFFVQSPPIKMVPLLQYFFFFNFRHISLLMAISGTDPNITRTGRIVGSNFHSSLVPNFCCLCLCC